VRREWQVRGDAGRPASTGDNSCRAKRGCAVWEPTGAAVEPRPGRWCAIGRSSTNSAPPFDLKPTRHSLPWPCAGRRLVVRGGGDGGAGEGGGVLGQVPSRWDRKFSGYGSRYESEKGGRHTRDLTVGAEEGSLRNLKKLLCPPLRMRPAPRSIGPRITCLESGGVEATSRLDVPR
jgi:hypothetical protein